MLAAELEPRGERQRLGLEALPPTNGGGTLLELLSWWLETYVKQGSPKNYGRLVGVVRLHFGDADLGQLRLTEVTSGVLEEVLQDKASELSPATVNHVRSYVCTAFSRAIRAGKWNGRNPALEVRPRKVPKRLPDYLKAEEVPRVFAALEERHRPLFATAIFTGMRKGELAGLRKTDVDLDAGLIAVQRSYDQQTTKGKRATAIPIAKALRPYLEAAMNASPSDLVFSDADGNMLLPLEKLLRRALARAGITLGYTHVCRKKGCGHAEEAPDAELRHCPKHKWKLWPKAKVRRIRFHDLRHTTASLLMMAGANPAAVQRILRHSDPRITTEVYGHLAPGYLKDEADRLSFGSQSSEEVIVATLGKQFAAPLLHEIPIGLLGALGALAFPANSSGNLVARPKGFEPLTSGLEIHGSSS